MIYIFIGAWLAYLFYRISNNISEMYMLRYNLLNTDDAKEQFNRVRGLLKDMEGVKSIRQEVEDNSVVHVIIVQDFTIQNETKIRCRLAGSGVYYKIITKRDLLCSK